MKPTATITKKKDTQERKSSKSQTTTSSLYNNGLEESSVPIQVFTKYEEIYTKSQYDDDDFEIENKECLPANEDIDVEQIRQFTLSKEDASCLFCEGQ